MRDEAFRAWLKGRFSKEGTWSTYMSDCRRVERHMGDLDNHYREDRLEKVLAGFAYSKLEGIEPSHPIPHNADPYTTAGAFRTAVQHYRKFCDEMAEAGDDEDYTEGAPKADESTLVFNLESHLQSALRANLDQLESGLIEDDDGTERRVATGFIDITARDQKGRIVVIELKAGPADSRAISQIASYMGAIAGEVEEEVRGILVAADFQEKAQMAARVIPTLKLKTYRYSFSFQDLN